jgi:predicted PurR-regulated permease PerM
MHKDATSRVLFVILLLLVVWAALQVLLPFLAGLTWAAVLVVTFRPAHRRLAITLGGRTWAATAIVTVIVAAFVIVPVTIAAGQAIQGALAAFEWVQHTYQAGAGAGTEALPSWLGDLVERGKVLVGLAGVDLHAKLVQWLRGFVEFLATRGSALVGGTLGMTFSFLVTIFGIPLLFARGESLTEALARALPLRLEDGRRILADIGSMTRSVLISVGMTALVQAALAGLAFVVLGVPRPLSLSAVTFFVAIIPGGVALVWIPVSVWLAVNGQPWSAGAMAAWGALVVGTIDNVLRPMFAGRGVKLEGAALFLGMVGGMIAFGLVGLFLGPIALYSARELVAILRRDGYAEPAPTMTTPL